MGIASIEEWGEHDPCLSHEDLRSPFEQWMMSEYSTPDLAWNVACSCYHNMETELRYIGFCEGAFFMCYHKENKDA